MTEEKEVVSIEDTMSAAYDEHMAVETNEIPTVDAPEEASEEIVETPTETEAESTPEEEPVAPPASWTAEAKEVFTQLPKETQKFISEREAQREKTINQALAKSAELEKSYSAIGQVTQKWGQYFNQLKVTPEVALDTLVQAEYTLRNGSLQDKMAMFQQLAADYGIPMNAQNEQGDVNPIVAQLSDKLRSVESKLAAYEQSQEDWRTQQGMTIIEQFQNEKDASGNLLHPYFEDTVETIKGLIQSGLANGLPDAYEKAIKIVPEVMSKIQAAEKKKQELSATEKAKKARTEASVKSRSVPSKMMAKASSIDETLERAYHEAMG
ncbi:hypothetical protein UFOVP353_8 [uncultured Caudovirales phage]|uniref:Uncharacterized protein n=1 Tax=uncultured Caudovirales phage TaxID=2100421 RepID=A0A6J5M2G6_9CAUD|nr:hypothetical protein UFOVP353_8 [uncultured Caudovirales phage]